MGNDDAGSGIKSNSIMIIPHPRSLDDCPGKPVGNAEPPACRLHSSDSHTPGHPAHLPPRQILLGSPTGEIDKHGNGRSKSFRIQLIYFPPSTCVSGPGRVPSALG